MQFPHYQTKLPKIKQKHIAYYIYHPFGENIINYKVLFNVNIFYNTNLAYCVTIFNKIPIGKTNNMYSLVNYVFMIPNFALKVIIWQLFMQISKQGNNQPYKT